MMAAAWLVCLVTRSRLLIGLLCLLLLLAGLASCSPHSSLVLAIFSFSCLATLYTMQLLCKRVTPLPLAWPGPTLPTPTHPVPALFEQVVAALVGAASDQLLDRVRLAAELRTLLAALCGAVTGRANTAVLLAGLATVITRHQCRLVVAAAAGGPGWRTDHPGAAAPLAWLDRVAARLLTHLGLPPCLPLTIVRASLLDWSLERGGADLASWVALFETTEMPVQEILQEPLTPNKEVEDLEHSIEKLRNLLKQKHSQNCCEETQSYLR